MKYLTPFLLTGVFLALVLVIIFLVSALQRLKKDLIWLQEEHKTSGYVLEALLQDRIDQIRKLSDTYQYWTEEAICQREKQEGRYTKEEIIGLLRRDICELRGGPHWMANLESAIDQACGQPMKQLRELVEHTPGLRFHERDYELLTLFFAGFSSKSISFLLDMTDDAVRKRKSRYKNLFISRGDGFSSFLERLH